MKFTATPPPGPHPTYICCYLAWYCRRLLAVPLTSLPSCCGRVVWLMLMTAEAAAPTAEALCC